MRIGGLAPNDISARADVMVHHYIAALTNTSTSPLSFLGLIDAGGGKTQAACQRRATAKWTSRTRRFAGASGELRVILAELGFDSAAVVAELEPQVSAHAQAHPPKTCRGIDAAAAAATLAQSDSA